MKIDKPNEVDKFHLEVPVTNGSKNCFGFFKGFGMIDYKNTFKIWLRSFPKPVLIFAIKDNSIVAWVYVEEWGDASRDGEPAYILRAIETVPELRSRKIGYRLLVLSLRQIIGYMLTKPMNKSAERFFKNAGFMEEREFRSPPIDLRMHPGHLLLPPFKRKEILKAGDAYFQSEMNVPTREE